MTLQHTVSQAIACLKPFERVTTHQLARKAKVAHSPDFLSEVENLVLRGKAYRCTDDKVQRITFGLVDFELFLNDIRFTKLSVKVRDSETTLVVQITDDLSFDFVVSDDDALKLSDDLALNAIANFGKQLEQNL